MDVPTPPPYTHPWLLPGLGQRLWAAPLKSVTCSVCLETLGALAPSAVSWSWGRVCADSSCSVLNVLSTTWEESAVIQPRPGAEPLAPTLALWPPPELVPVEVAALSSRAQGGALGFDQEQVSRPYKGWESALDRRLCDNLTQCGKGGCYCSLSQPARPRQCICGPEVEGEDWAQW